MLDHVGFAVSDYGRSKTFYEQALAPAGLRAAAGAGESRRGVRPRREAVLLDRGPRAGGDGQAPRRLRRRDRPTVDAFHAAALAAGGTDNGAPGVRAIYHPDYYGAYVFDPDGNNIEAVCHAPA